MKDKKKLIIILGSLIGILLIIACIYLIVNKDSNNKLNDNKNNTEEKPSEISRFEISLFDVK